MINPSDLPPRRSLMPSLVSRDSRIRKLPANINPRHQAILDAIRYSCDMAGLAFHRLEKSLEFLSANEVPEREAPGFVSAFADAWMLIDAASRLRPLATMLPGSKELLSVQNLLTATGDVRELRNRVQHLNARIDRLVSQKESVWGSLSWVLLDVGAEPIGVAQHIIVSGTVRKHFAKLPSPSGLTYYSQLDRITLRAHDLEVQLHEVMDAIAVYLIELERIVGPQLERGEGGSLTDVHAILEGCFPGESPSE